MKCRLLQKEYKPEIVHIECTFNTAADALCRLDTAPTYTFHKELLWNLIESDQYYSQHEHMTMVLTHSLSDNTDLGA